MSCTLSLTFSPTVVGSFSSSISIADNPTGSPQVITLNGTAILQAALTLEDKNFESIGVGITSSARTAMLQNNLNTSLAITGINSGGDFATPSNTCGSSVPAHSQCSIWVTFTPTQLGNRKGSLSVTDTANNSSQTISLQGTGTLASLTSIWVTPANISKVVGSTQQFTATGTFPTAILLDLTHLVHWSSSATVVATISNLTGSQGLATGKSAGTTTISATVNQIIGSTSLTIGSGGKTTPTITWATPAPITYGTALSGTQLNVTANVPGTFAYAPVAGTILSAGSQTLNVVFTPTDSTNYTTASKSVSLAVNKAVATVMPNAASKICGTADPVFTGTLIGFLPGDGVAATYTRTAGETVVGSPYMISVILAPAGVLANYTITYNTAAFTINKATAAVMANVGSKTYGATDPALSATETGFTAADALTITLTLARAAGENVGTYTITPSASGAALANYKVTYTPALFTISQATPTVNVTGGTFTDDGTPHPATATATGVGGANVSGSFAFSYSLGGTAAPINAGTYGVTATFTSSDPNYTTASGNGTIIVNPPAVTLMSIAITPPNPFISLGGTENFSATGTYSDNSTAILTTTANWTSSSPIAATVSAAGVATAANSGCGGPTTITAAVGSVQGSTVLTVIVPGGFTCGGNMIHPRDPHTATLLTDGRVIITGGFSTGGTATATAEIYSPSTNSSVATGNMNFARANHTATLLANGKVLIAGGVDAGGTPLATAEIFDPTGNAGAGTFTLVASSMSTSHTNHTATVLSDGTVAIIGGYGFITNGVPNAVSTTEIYNPTTGAFVAGGKLVTARADHTAIALNDGSGNVLIAGGLDSTGTPLNTLENYSFSCYCSSLIYDNTGTQLVMSDYRAKHSATLMDNGTVLLVGGEDLILSGVGLASLSADIYDPVALTLTSAAAPITPRFSHTATLLANGTVLIVGGETYNSSTDSDAPTAGAELYNPNAQVFSSTTGPVGAPTRLNTARDEQTATLLPSGNVLFTGGLDAAGAPTNGIEMYSPQSLLPAGFTGPISLTPSESEIPVPTTVQFIASATINGATQTLSGLNWSSSNTGLLTVTNDSSSQGLAQAVVPGPVAPTPVTVQACFGSSGICGFASISVTPPALVSIAVMPGTSVMSVPPGIPVTFTATGTFTDGTSSSITPSWASSLGFASINMNTGVASPGTGYGATMITASAPGANGTTITGTATLNVTQVIGTGNPQFNTQYSTASVLNCAYPVGSASQCFNDGKVLIAAGENTNGPVLYGQLYDPVAGTFTVTTGSLSFGRSGGSTATVLDSGKVLIAGGITSALNLPGSAELYDPVTDTFTTVGSLITPRSNHTATLIHCQPCPYNGQVLIAGGQDAFANLLSSAELFDPVSNTFAPAPNMNNPRAHFTATLLDSATGKVLLAGGYNSLAPISAGFFPLSTNTAEVFDPGTGTFTLTGTLASCPDTFGLAYQTATLLNDNSVLIAGGQGFQGSLARFSEPSCSQLFNLATGSFTPTARLYSDRLFDAATLLKNGMLLISGGAPDSSFEPPPYNELFDPNGSAGVGTFTQVGMLLAMRTNAAVALLNDGNVLIAGGDVQGTAEVYRPASLVPPGVTGSSIAITPASASLSVGQAVHFTATANGQTLNALTWSASPVGIVTISNDATNNGTAYAVATGNVTISACAGTACASRLLTVQ